LFEELDEAVQPELLVTVADQLAEELDVAFQPELLGAVAGHGAPDVVGNVVGARTTDADVLGA